MKQAKISESKKAEKDLDRVPKEILRAYEIWARLIEEHGASVLRKFSGYRDEMLRGEWPVLPPTITGGSNESKIKIRVKPWRSR